MLRNDSLHKALTLVALVASQFLLMQTGHTQPTPADQTPAFLKQTHNSRDQQRFSRPVRPKQVEIGSPVIGEELFTERYSDGSIRVEREVALDSDDNYVNHGPYRIWNQDGQLIAEGTYDMGVRVGVWSRWADRKESPLLNEAPFKKFSGPFLSQATFADGILDGEWIIFDGRQRKCSQISIQDGKRHGHAILWDVDGKVIQQSTYDHGLPQGEVLKQLSGKNALSRVRLFVDGRQVINKKTHFPNSKQIKSEENYLGAPMVQTRPDNFWEIRFAEHKSQGKSLRHGSWKTWLADGKRHMQGQFDHDKRVGPFVYWHNNGQVAVEGEFRDGKHHGEWVWWHPNGQKAVVGNFRDGALIDDWRWWAKSGKLERQVEHDGTKMMKSSDAKLELGSRDTAGPDIVK